jgi:hypothetical protein
MLTRPPSSTTLCRPRSQYLPDVPAEKTSTPHHPIVIMTAVQPRKKRRPPKQLLHHHPSLSRGKDETFTEWSIQGDTTTTTTIDLTQLCPRAAMYIHTWLATERVCQKPPTSSGQRGRSRSYYAGESAIGTATSWSRHTDTVALGNRRTPRPFTNQTCIKRTTPTKPVERQNPDTITPDPRVTVSGILYRLTTRIRHQRNMSTSAAATLGSGHDTNQRDSRTLMIKKSVCAGRRMYCLLFLAAELIYDLSSVRNSSVPTNPLRDVRSS